MKKEAACFLSIYYSDHWYICLSRKMTDNRSRPTISLRGIFLSPQFSAQQVPPKCLCLHVYVVVRFCRFVLYLVRGLSRFEHVAHQVIVDGPSIITAAEVHQQEAVLLEGVDLMEAEQRLGVVLHWDWLLYRGGCV